MDKTLHDMRDEELVAAFHGGNNDARSVLTDRYLEKIKRYARMQIKRCPKSIDPGDLLSFAFIAFLEAVEKYDYSRGMCFADFASLKLQFGITEQIRNEVGLRVKYRDITRVAIFSQIVAEDSRDDFETSHCTTYDKNVPKLLLDETWFRINKMRSQWDKQLLNAHFRYGFSMRHIAQRMGFTDSYISLEITAIL